MLRGNLLDIRIAKVLDKLSMKLIKGGEHTAPPNNDDDTDPTGAIDEKKKKEAEW